MIEQNTQAIIAVSREAGVASVIKPEEKEINGVKCLVTKDGTIIPLRVSERYLEAPRRKRARVDVHDTASFINYVNRHKLDGRTTIFGNATELGGSFRAILDYHQEERRVEADKTKSGQTDPSSTPGAVAMFGDHEISLKLETTPEWRRWVGNDRKLLTQEAFAEFIQENMSDIVKPDAGIIIDMAQLLIAKKSVAFRSGKNLKNGAINLEYSETIEVQGTANQRSDQMEVPDSFTLGIVPFLGANGIEIGARLRFRIGDDRKLYFQYVLDRTYKVIETAFSVARRDIETETGLFVLLGNGEIEIKD
jgi:uncharacterized protein YfdQ (DUF2303 family)